MPATNPPYTPDLSGEPAWQPLIIPGLLTNPNSFVSGNPAGNRLRVKYYYDDEANKMIARTWFGPGAEGPPRHAHGGSIAAVLDEAMGIAALYAGHTVVAANISINFHKLVPLNSVVSAITWVKKVAGKKVHTQCELKGPGGATYASGTGLFITISFNDIAALME